MAVDFYVLEALSDQPQLLNYSTIINIIITSYLSTKVLTCSDFHPPPSHFLTSMIIGIEIKVTTYRLQSGYTLQTA